MPSSRLSLYSHIRRGRSSRLPSRSLLAEDSSSPRLTNFLRCPACISSSILSFRVKQSSVAPQRYKHDDTRPGEAVYILANSSSEGAKHRPARSVSQPYWAENIPAILGREHLGHSGASAHLGHALGRAHISHALGRVYIGHAGAWPRQRVLWPSMTTYSLAPGNPRRLEQKEYAISIRKEDDDIKSMQSRSERKMIISRICNIEHKEVQSRQEHAISGKKEHNDTQRL